MPTDPISCTTAPGCEASAQYQITAGDGADGRRNRLYLRACEPHLPAAQRTARTREHRQTITLASRPSSLPNEGTNQ